MTASGAAPAGADTVFFLSDYGRSDEFVGVVHAVLRRLAPRARVIDLTHDLAPFDVVAGARALARSQPFLGPGVVLAVVDPGVGGSRRGVAVEVAGTTGPRFWVGPDNGLLWPATTAAGGALGAVTLGSSRGRPSTFDGRDVFAPAVAALCEGSVLTDLGPRLDPATLVALDDPVVATGRDADGRHRLRAEVTWVDRFGNAQLAAAADCLPASVDEVTLGLAAGERRVRRVSAFSDLLAGEQGILVDANGSLALVVREGSAATELGLAVGSVVEARW